MSPARGSEKSNMSTARVCQPANRKMTKREAVRRLVRLVEEDMDRKGLSDDKKNDRVRQFIAHVDAVSAGRAK